jgi:uncharacterized membrane protein YfcA
MKIAIIALVIGLASGAIAALCGVGGGLLMVPAFVGFLGMSQKAAVATSLAVIVPTALSATVMNWRGGTIDRQVLIWTALGAIITAVFFTSKLKSISDSTLTKVFALFAIGMGVKLLWSETGGKKTLAPPGGAEPSSASYSKDRD